MGRAGNEPPQQPTEALFMLSSPQPGATCSARDKRKLTNTGGEGHSPRAARPLALCGRHRGHKDYTRSRSCFPRALNPKAPLRSLLDLVQVPKPPGPQFPHLQQCRKALEGNLSENALQTTYVNQKQHCPLAIVIKPTGVALFSGLFFSFPTT